MFARGSIMRGVFSDMKSPIAYGYTEKDLPVYFNQDPVFNVPAGGAGGRGGGGRGGGVPGEVNGEAGADRGGEHAGDFDFAFWAESGIASGSGYGRRGTGVR